MRILVTTFGSLGDVYPYLAIAEELVKRGASVTFVTNSQHRDLIESHGHGFHSLRPEIQPDAEFFRKVMSERNGSRFLLREILFPAIRDSYADIMAAIPGHDLLITHMATFAGPLVARTTGIPWISTVLAPISFFSRQDPPALATSLISLRRRFPALTRFVNKLAKRSTQSWGSSVRELQSELGLPNTGNPLFEGQHSPTLALALFSSHFAEPQPDWPANTLVTGFPFSAPALLPQPVERFLAAGPAPIVFTLGSSAVQTPGRFFELARNLKRRAILLAGPEAANIPSSPDLLIVSYAPHSAVFPHAAAIVHQGGVGTTAEALRSGRPSLIVPFAHDQPDNAARCERLGVARILGRPVLSTKRVERELEILTDSKYQAAAKSLGETIRQESGARVAAKALWPLVVPTYGQGTGIVENALS